MAYCFECGEQIAENDIFCPYCGISIQPMTVGGGEDDASFDKTMVISPPPTSGAKSEVPPVPPFVKPDETPLEKRLFNDNLKNKTDDFFNDITSENVDVKTALAKNSSPSVEDQPILTEDRRAIKSTSDTVNDLSFDKNYRDSTPPQNTEAVKYNSGVPAPKILETFDDEKAAASPLPKFDLPNAKPVSDLGVKFDFTINKDENRKISDESDDALKSPTESSLMSYEEAEVKEVLSAEEPDKAVDNTPNAPDKAEVRDGAMEDSGSAEKLEAVSPIKNLTAAAELPIAMPEIELPVVENCLPSKFDSVSIMEKKEEVEEESKEIVSAGAMSAQSKSAEESKTHGSFTAPISANSDTGGKNKTKLKPLDEGTVLNGRYEIIRKIGGGGMGAVYLASDKNLGGVLRAVKEMVQSYIEDEQQEKAVNDFKRESLLLTSLDHQSIPTIYDYFFDETEARFYLVMKYISGGDLSGRLRSAPESRIDELSVTNWAIQIADVLDYLHNRQPPIVYRDLKPANIMVDSNSGRVMLIDFGIARWVNKEEKGVTAVGTMGYAPPELFSGNVEARSDIYSLGSTMFHLLTGADPQSNPLLIFDFQKHPRPRQINPQLSDQMERILMRAVEYNANKRFASAAELKKALEEHQENLKAGRVSYGVKEAPLSVALSDQPVFCGFCGQKIVATDMFCAFCGSKQPLAQQGVHSHSEGYAPMPLTAQLLIIGTNDLEQPAYRLEKEDNLVGRRDPMSNIFPEVDLSKFDPQTKISRRHARIWREGNEFMVEDLGSSNGTYILPVVSDTMRLQPHQPQLLTNGDKIRLGDTTLHFILG